MYQRHTLGPPRPVPAEVVAHANVGSTAVSDRIVPVLKTRFEGARVTESRIHNPRIGARGQDWKHKPIPAYSENPHWVAVRKKKELMRAVWVATSTGPSLPAMNATVCAGEWVGEWVGECDVGGSILIRQGLIGRMS